MPSEPFVLGFDTSAAHCAAALLCGSELVAYACEDMARGQAERIMPLLEEVLSAGSANWQDLGAIGVGIGPGNFTGIRISVAAARGLALALDIPAVGVSQFEALAFGYEAPVVCSVAAPRERLYIQTVNTAEGSDPVLCDFQSLPLPNPKTEAAAIGARACEIAKLTGGHVQKPAFPLAEAIARQAQSRMSNHHISAPAPMYLRPADAAPSRETAPVILDQPPS